MKITSSRFTSSQTETRTRPDASLPPHMEHLRRKKRERAARPSRAGGGARVNETVEFVRSMTPSARKRGAARYGPPPKNPPHPGMQAPMTAERREAIYRSGRQRMTARQERQFFRMGERNDGLLRLGVKGRPTPKRRRSS